jgi:hypothetical protein
MIANQCPRCHGPVQKTRGTYNCPSCHGWLNDTECVACGRRFFVLSCYLSSEEARKHELWQANRVWHDHHCPPGHERAKEAGQHLAALWEAGDLTHPPTEGERLTAGFRMLRLGGDWDG